ncbi:class I SAM-dependent methyltransferase [Clostridiaceae bacterium M8S5]|nr:class I SAM-dependent methyltransferase [Clostridiaceae bacterium M8S5]
MEANISSAYKSSKNIYDSVLTKGNFWAKLYNNIFWNVDDIDIADKVLNFLPNDFDGKLLDVPVGTAVFTHEKYRKLKKAHIIALDFSNEMLEKAKIRLNSNTKCMQGDVGDLPFDDENFDVVLSMNGFHAFKDKQSAFSETVRVLKKGGMFIGCFYIRKEKLLTDFVVNNVLSKKGWFTPPFYTREN